MDSGSLEGKDTGTDRERRREREREGKRQGGKEIHIYIGREEIGR